jgi:hypothetical protein
VQSTELKLDLGNVCGAEQWDYRGVVIDIRRIELPFYPGLEIFCGPFDHLRGKDTSMFAEAFPQNFFEILFQLKSTAGRPGTRRTFFDLKPGICIGNLVSDQILNQLSHCQLAPRTTVPPPASQTMKLSPSLRSNWLPAVAQ